MNVNIKTKVLPILALSFLSFSNYSCKKTNITFDTYFYLSKSIKEAAAMVVIDGIDRGAINFAASPVTTSSPGLNHLQLPGGRHTILVKDNNGNGIISAYIDLYEGGGGTGSWGNAGGGTECMGDANNHTELVGMFE